MYNPPAVELLTCFISLSGPDLISLSGWYLLPLCGPHPSTPSIAPSTWDHSTFREIPQTPQSIYLISVNFFNKLMIITYMNGQDRQIDVVQQLIMVFHRLTG